MNLEKPFVPNAKIQFQKVLTIEQPIQHQKRSRETRPLILILLKEFKPLVIPLSFREFLLLIHQPGQDYLVTVFLHLHGLVPAYRCYN